MGWSLTIMKVWPPALPFVEFDLGPCYSQNVSLVCSKPETDGEDLESEATCLNVYPQSFLPREVLCDLPRLGTVLPIKPEIQLDDLPGQLPQCGDWVKFRNLTCRSRSGILEAIFTRESKISLLSKDTQLVQNCERYALRCTWSCSW